MSELKADTILNDQQYQIIEVIGKGGFGITYLAHELGYYRQSGFGKQYVKHRNPETVVIKELYYNDYCTRDQQTGLISISNADKKIEFERLVKNQLNEGKIIRSLDHPNIVSTRDIFEENDTAYMVMDYIESVDLEDLIKKNGRLPKEQALKYILEILDAADYIHNHADKRIIHLDISPSNILIDTEKDSAILIDFGAALTYDTVQNRVTSTTSQIITGRKKHYSPNEQSDLDLIKSFDATFDTYAIGATLYHLLSGKLPPPSNLLSSGREVFIPPSKQAGDDSISDFLDAVVEKGMSPQYRARYVSAAAMTADLKKEGDYIETVSKIENLIKEGKTDEADALLNEAKDKFLETDTLLKLSAQVQTHKSTTTQSPASYTVDDEETQLISATTQAKKQTPTPPKKKEKAKPIEKKPEAKVEKATPVIEKKPEPVKEKAKSEKVKEKPVEKKKEKSSTSKKNKKPILIAAAAVVGVAAIGMTTFLMKQPEAPKEEPVQTSVIPVDDHPVLYEEDGLFGYKIGDSLAIHPAFTAAEDFENEKARVTRNDSIFFIDEKGQFIELIAVETKKEPEEIIVASTHDAPVESEEEREQKAWNLAQRNNTQRAYQNYLNQHPKGPNAKEASEKISELKQLALEEAERRAQQVELERRTANMTEEERLTAEQEEIERIRREIREKERREELERRRGGGTTTTPATPPTMTQEEIQREREARDRETREKENIHNNKQRAQSLIDSAKEMIDRGGIEKCKSTTCKIGVIENLNEALKLDPGNSEALRLLREMNN